jgi:hypothetical protein
MSRTPRGSRRALGFRDQAAPGAVHLPAGGEGASRTPKAAARPHSRRVPSPIGLLLHPAETRGVEPHASRRAPPSKRALLRADFVSTSPRATVRGVGIEPTCSSLSSWRSPRERAPRADCLDALHHDGGRPGDRTLRQRCVGPSRSPARSPPGGRDGGTRTLAAGLMRASANPLGIALSRTLVSAGPPVRSRTGCSAFARPIVAPPRRGEAGPLRMESAR